LPERDIVGECYPSGDLRNPSGDLRTPTGDLRSPAARTEPVPQRTRPECAAGCSVGGSEDG